MRISDWSSDVCSSDLNVGGLRAFFTENATLDASESVSIKNPETGSDDRPLGDAKRQGNSVIAEFIIDSVRGFRTAHQVHTPIIEFLSDDEAQVLWAMEDNLWSASGVPFKSLHGVGHYHEVYSKTGDQWLIKSMKLTRLHVEIVGERPDDLRSRQNNA